MTPAYDRELIAEMLDELAEAALNKGGSRFSVRAIAEQARLLREANNAEAANVETVNSRSRLRRIAAERGEPAPRFDASEDGLLPEAAAAWLESHISVLRHDGFAATADVLGRIVALIRRLAASGDAYVSEQGSVTVDWDDDPQRQLSIMVKPDGSVSFAALANGQRFSGDGLPSLNYLSPEWEALITRIYQLLCQLPVEVTHEIEGAIRRLAASGQGADAKDAARYRWMKQWDVGIAHEGGSDFRWWAYAEGSGIESGLDSVIDAARRE